MMHFSMLWPGGREKALTLSYDDAVLQDIRLLEIMNANGIKGTFNLNSGYLGGKATLIREGHLVQHNKVAPEEIAEVYKGHEVAVHTVTHPNLVDLPDAQVLYEVLEDRKNLENLVGYPVRGMAYPSGRVDQRVVDLMKGTGIVFARGVDTTKNFAVPKKETWLNWRCSCHHWELEPLIDPFLHENGLKLLSVWGHAYEFDQRDDWEVIEDQLARLGGHEDVWYAANIDVFDYITAYNSLDVAVDGSSAYNRSSVSVWVRAKGKKYEIPAGGVVRF
ncbi:MAG: polysaccharide deacetylase family protein [Clostridia bacterium]|nr:polysaccharide deacetylase family protein [Clostridia bacterium]